MINNYIQSIFIKWFTLPPGVIYIGDLSDGDTEKSPPPISSDNSLIRASFNYVSHM